MSLKRVFRSYLERGWAGSAEAFWQCGWSGQIVSVVDDLKSAKTSHTHLNGWVFNSKQSKVTVSNLLWIREHYNYIYWTGHVWWSDILNIYSEVCRWKPAVMRGLASTSLCLQDRSNSLHALTNSSGLLMKWRSRTEMVLWSSSAEAASCTHNSSRRHIWYLYASYWYFACEHFRFWNIGAQGKCNFMCRK